MWWIISGIVLIVLVVAVYFIVTNYLQFDLSRKQKIYESLEKFGKLDSDGPFFKYHYNNEKYYLLVIKVHRHARFSFNSKIVWESYHGSQKRFLDQRVFGNLPGKKIVIIYPHVGPFLRYEDEHNIVFTKPNERFWDMYVMAANDIEETLTKGF